VGQSSDLAIRAGARSRYGGTTVELVKLVVFVPVSHAEAVRMAI
jgi:hypothetical protein